MRGALCVLPSFLSTRDLSLLARDLAGTRFRKPSQQGLSSEISREVHLRSKRKADSYFGENKPHAGLGRKALHSGVTFVAARGVNIFVQLASTILLARLLSPHDFGLVAMVL